MARLGSRLIVLIAMVSCARVAAAQHYVESWTTENGLPHNIVGALQQTRDGYIWMATFDGLVRFDGVRFTVFNRSNSPGLLLRFWPLPGSRDTRDTHAIVSVNAVLKDREGKDFATEGMYERITPGSSEPFDIPAFRRRGVRGANHAL